MRQPDGATLRDHLRAAAAASGVEDPRLKRRCPAAVRALWDIYTDVEAGRPQGLSGLARIPPSELQSWCELHQVRLTVWEVETLLAMDRAAVARAHANAAKPGGT